MSLVTDFPCTWLSVLPQDTRSEVTSILTRIDTALADAQEQAVIFPSRNLIFRALEALNPDQVKVVIVGQDCYHGLSKLPDGRLVPQATGLAFSVPPGARPQPSLRNIVKELREDLQMDVPDTGDLSPWAKQGVLLLNRALTVEQGKPASHKALGWHEITRHLIVALAQSKAPMVFMLWGRHAQELRSDIETGDHLILEASHPSPMGGSCYKGFFGQRMFSKANTYLVENGRSPVDWSL